jgi:DNA primase
LAGISDEKLEELRERVDIATVVGRRVQLKRAGNSMKGLCPFHGEKTPSFNVIPDKKFFHCFGCGKSGDAIKFVMELEGKSFREAVEQLANEFGVVLESEDPLERKRSERRGALAEVNEKACVFFERVLWEHPRGAVAREHLEKRGVTQETCKAWRLGYAPELWDALSKSLARSKIDPALIEEAGLAVPRKKGGQGLYDRFRGRLIIPIRESGRTVAFGGRLLEGESDAKYLNSPETPLYQKGATLFGLDKAREGIRKEGIALFVEGYFDAIGLHQAGITNAVATCGTAMTERHLETVQRAGAKELVFVFDGDNAGIRAATRASELAAAAGVAARVLVPPDGEDPDETVARIGAEAFRELLKNSEPSLQFLLEKALSTVGSSIEARVRAVASIAGIVRAAPNLLAKELYIEKVAEKLGASADIVRLAIDQAPREPAPVQHAPAPQSNSEARVRQQQQAEQAQRPMGNTVRPAPQKIAPSRPNGSQRSEPTQKFQDQRAQNQGLQSQAPQNARPEPQRQTTQRPQSQPVQRTQNQPVQKLAGRRDAPLQELHLVAQILQSAELARFIEDCGGAAAFTNATLRDLAEQAFAQAKTGGFDRAAVIDSIDNDALRLRLGKLVDEAASGRAALPNDAAAHELEKQRLKAIIAKHAKTAGEEEIRRRPGTRPNSDR